MTTIIFTVSRPDYLEQVISKIELLECDAKQTNILCIVDGDASLYVRARNLISDTKFNQRLTVKSDYPGTPARFNMLERRRRIAFIHNQAKDLIHHNDGYVFSVEDDTLIPTNALSKLMKIALDNRAFAMAEGVELGRWGVPYVGAWIADDIYEPKEIVSVENQRPAAGKTYTNIDAGGLYCSLIRADLYKQHNFTSANGLGPDVNFCLENRRLGFENFIDWSIPCTHIFTLGGSEHKITPKDPSKVVTLVKRNDTKWAASY